MSQPRGSGAAPLLIAAVFQMAGSRDVQACDFCMMGQGISPYLTASGKGLTLDATYTESDHLYDQSSDIASNGKKEAWLIWTLTGFYPVTEDLTVLASLPYTSKTNIDFDSTSDTNPGTLTTGIGDASLTGRYTLFKNHTLTSTFIGGLLAGVKFPTGTTNNRDQSGNPVDRHALPGTGSFDYHLGFTEAYTVASGIQLTSDLIYNISGPGSWAERDHRYGNSLNFSVKGFYRVYPSVPGATSVMPYLGLSGEWTGEEEGVQTAAGYDPGSDNPSSGGTVVFGDLGLYSMLNVNTMLNLSFSKAFYHHMNFDPAFDADPAENYRLDFSLTYLF